MKVAILAGGLGSRLAEETEVKPKPMVEIGGKPILWHIMMHYAHYGFDEFAIALGYKGEVIKKYMLDYCSLNRDLSVSLKTGKVKMNGGAVPDWNGGPDRYRHEDPDRRTHQAARSVPGQRNLHAHLGRWRIRHQPARPAGVPSLARQAGHAHRCPADGALWPPGDGWQSDHRVLREAADQRRLDQRSVLRA